MDSKIKDYNYYLKNDMFFNKIKAWKGKYAWLNSSIIDLNEKLDKKEKYDIILLSNIMDYAKYLYAGEKFNESFMNNIIVPFVKRLNKGGKIYAACIFDIHKDEQNELLDMKFWESVFHKEKILVEKVIYSSAIDNDKEDATIILNNAA